MPRGKWTAKDERKFERILESCRFGDHPKSKKVCERIAAATVNRDRKALGALTSDLDPRSRVIIETSTEPLKKGIPRVIKARDPETGTLVGELKLRSSANGVTVEWAEVDYSRRGTKITQALYRRAAELACAQGWTVHSDVTRSEAADSFWKKQVRAGHAVAVAGRGTRYNPDTGRAKGKLDVKHYELLCPARELARIGGGVGDVLGQRSKRAQRLTEQRAGVRLVAERQREPGKYAYEIIGADGKDIGRMVLSVVKFRDIPDDDGFDVREGLEVTGINLNPSVQRKGIGTKLYEAAADAACLLYLPLVSDRVRSRFAEAFWRKQVSKGRAYAVEGGGGAVFPGPLAEAEEHMQREVYALELRDAGDTPAGRRLAQQRTEEAIEAWRSRLPEPPTSDSWPAERYVLDDSCKHAGDLSRIGRKRKRR